MYREIGLLNTIIVSRLYVLKPYLVVVAKLLCRFLLPWVFVSINLCTIFNFQMIANILYEFGYNYYSKIENFIPSSLARTIRPSYAPLLG